jgi:hypothetical protein
VPQLPGAQVGPNIEIDIDQKHVVELIDMEETPSQFRDKRKDAMTIIWKMNVWNMATGAAIIDDNDGLMWEHWGFTPDGTWRNTNSGKAAKAREWTEAFLGREISDDEMSELIRRGFKEGLLNKKAVADFEWYTDKNGIEKVRIIRLRPYKAAQNGTAAKQQPAVTATAAETPEERRARLRRELEEMEGALPS